MYFKLKGFLHCVTLTSMSDYISRQGSAAVPKHPQYSVETVRLSSFSRWPPTSPQIPSVLCDAGFFYAGFSDCVRCFFCGGGLRNWEDGDIAWIEHARWYSDCEFLRQRKGELFIQMHRQDNNESYQQLPGNIYDRISTEDEHDQRQNQEQNLRTEDVTAEETERRQTSIRSVVEMGYPQSVVDICVLKLTERGNTNFTATDIMEIIFETEEQRNELQDDVQSGIASVQSEAQAGHRPSDKQVSNRPEVSAISTTSVDFKSLVKENRDLKEQMICKICLVNDACIVYLPCGHMATCQKCAPTTRKCCICRQLIQGTVRAYM